LRNLHHVTVRPAEERRQELVALYHELKDCHSCPLAETRTNVVFGMGNADADLMFVGEAPGMHEDQQGLPFVGRAGKLLDQLLEEIGLERRQDAFICNLLKCRPPGNRDPLPEEIEECRPHLFKQIELIQPRLICTLGNFATKLLSGSPQGITRVHGRPQERSLGGLDVTLYPIFHPAAALRSTAVLEQLRDDFRQIPELLRNTLPPDERGDPEPAAVAASGDDDPASQLDLFG
jgi:DNA polymerase